MKDFSSISALCALCAGLAAGVPISGAAADPLTIFESTTPFVASSFRPLRLAGAALGSGAPYTYQNDSLSFSGLLAGDGVVRGSSPGVYAAPVTDADGDMFTGKYLSTGNTGYINIAFATPQQALSLLWGSVDPSNEITFLDGGQVVGVVDGTDIDPAAGGLQGVGGSAYVLIDSAIKFDDIEFSSGVPSFELADIRTSAVEIPVHEPPSIALFGGFLLCLLGVKRFGARGAPHRPAMP